MNRTRRRERRFHPPRCYGAKACTMPRAGAQRGVALVVALILLVVITLIGLAAVSGTIMQGKMAANQYDRQTAFQNAASALQVAQKRLLQNPDEIALHCRQAGTVCPANPFTDPDLAGSIQTVQTGTSAGQYTASAVAAGQPQYIIEDLGKWINPKGGQGFNQSANAKQYGAQGKSLTATYYRITARSGDPAQVGNRAIVTLQAVIKQD